MESQDVKFGHGASQETRGSKMWINKQKLLGTISQPTLKEILRAGWSQNYIQWRYCRTAEPQWMNVLYPPEPGHFIGVAFHFFQKSFIKVFLELQKLGFLLFFFRNHC